MSAQPARQFRSQTARRAASPSSNRSPVVGWLAATVAVWLSPMSQAGVDVWSPASLPSSFVSSGFPSPLAHDDSAGATYGLYTDGKTYRTVDGLNWQALNGLSCWYSTFSYIATGGGAVFGYNPGCGWALSRDNGVTWSYEGGPLTAQGYPTRALVSAGNVPYAFQAIGPNFFAVDIDGVIRSTNGVDWVRVLDTRVSHVGAGLSAIGTVGASIFVAGTNIALRSDDAGSTWNLVSFPAHQGNDGPRGNFPFATTGSTLYLLTSQNLYATTNLGVSWSVVLIGTTTKPGPTGVVAIAAIGGSLFALNLGTGGAAFWQTDDGGTTWVAKASGLPAAGTIGWQQGLAVGLTTFYLSISGGSVPVYQMTPTVVSFASGNSTSDGPMPVWALGALGATLLGMAGRRLGTGTLMRPR